jgi:hypothetical protein
MVGGGYKVNQDILPTASTPVTLFEALDKYGGA